MFDELSSGGFEPDDGGMDDPFMRACLQATATVAESLRAMDALAVATEQATRSFIGLFDDAMVIQLRRARVRATAAKKRGAKQRKRRHLARARR